MGFWGKLGKIALKVAPYAAMAIPGVGVPLGMAISGGLSAASKKASGGSWKDALISGGIGAGTSALGGKIPGLDKITGKAGSFVSKDIGDVAAKAAGKGLAPSLKQIAGKFGEDTLNNVIGGLANRPPRAEESGPTTVPPMQGAVPRTQPPTMANDGLRSGRPDMGNPLLNQMRRTLGPTTGVENQRTPNLALALGQGQMDALRAQPYNQLNQVRKKKPVSMMAAAQ